jgi:hypothetical protein
MPLGHYKKVIDPRTRADVEPGVVPFWHVKINAGPNRNIDFNTINENNEVRRYRTFTLLQWIDLISGILSLIALFISIDGVANLLGWNVDSRLEWPMWHENILCYNSSLHTSTEICINDKASFDQAFQNYSAVGMQYAYNTSNAALQGYCKKNEDYILPDNIGRQWNETKYQCQIITQKSGGFYVWTALRMVFAISACFQLGRFVLSRQESKRYQESRTKYWAHKPDFWRWWEYALTSPIQIFIIGLSFFMGSKSELMALAGLQAALCFMGFIIEKRIDKLYKAKIKVLRGEKSKDNDLKYIKILIVLSAAWTFFVIIWDFILWPRFNRQANNPENCHYGAPMPKEVRFIVWAEYILFLSFGLTQTLQVIVFIFDTSHFLRVFVNLNSSKENSNYEYFESRRKKRWYQFTTIYSILSITAKTLLEFGLLELSRRFSEMI